MVASTELPRSGAEPARRHLENTEPMPEVPRRISLHDQLVALLREGIRSGRWKGTMPPELSLCREFQVSRMTLRKGLAQLADEQWIELGGRGRFHRIRKRPKARKKTKGRIIRLLTPYQPASHSSYVREILTAAEERLASAGYRLESECHPRVYERFQPSQLARLDALPDTAGWMLAYTTPAIQEWFANCGRPTAVLGRVANGLPLSSVFADLEAVGRHAAGLFHSRGHREMVYLITNVTSLSDKLAAETFVAEARRLGARTRIVNHDQEPEAVNRCVMDLLASRPRPTAFFAGSNETSITLLCHLLAAGVRIPAEASVLSAAHDYHLQMTFPSIACYRTNGRVMGLRIGQLLIDLIRRGSGKVRAIPVMPEFVEGGTVAPSPARFVKRDT